MTHAWWILAAALFATPLVRLLLVRDMDIAFGDEYELTSFTFLVCWSAALGLVLGHWL